MRRASAANPSSIRGVQLGVELHHAVRSTTYLPLALTVVALSLSACDAEGSAAERGHSAVVAAAAVEAAVVEAAVVEAAGSGPRRPLSTSQGPTSWPA